MHVYRSKCDHCPVYICALNVFLNSNTQNLCGTDDTTESSFKSKEKASLQKEPERHDEQIIPEKNHNIVTALAEKAMSVASPVVPKKEDGEVDEERFWPQMHVLHNFLCPFLFF